MAEVFRRKVPAGYRIGVDGGFPRGGRVDPFGGMTEVLRRAEAGSPVERRTLLRVGKPDVIGVRNAVLVPPETDLPVGYSLFGLVLIPDSPAAAQHLSLDFYLSPERRGLSEWELSEDMKTRADARGGALLRLGEIEVDAEHIQERSAAGEVPDTDVAMADLLELYANGRPFTVLDVR